MDTKISIPEAILLKELERMNVTVFSGSFIMNDHRFRLHTYAEVFDTNEIYEFLGLHFSVKEEDITSDEEKGQGLCYSRYVFELFTE